MRLVNLLVFIFLLSGSIFCYFDIIVENIATLVNNILNIFVDFYLRWCKLYLPHMRTIGERVKERREALGMTQDQLAEKLGYEYRSSINKIELGYSNIPLKRVQDFARALHCSQEWLLGLDDIELPKPEPVIHLNVYGPLSCGRGAFVDDNIIDTITLPQSMLPKNKTLFAQYAKGDSMNGSGIGDGDLLVFAKEQCQPGDIGCFCFGEEATCKKLTISGNKIILMPTNDRYEPIIVNPEDFRCIGKLVLTIHKQ